MTKIVLLKGTAAIVKAIDSIKNRGAKLDASIQQAGLSVLAHASEHGDTTCADRLVHAMPKGGRKLALVEWMLAHGQVALLDKKDDKEAIAAGRVFKFDKARKLDLEGAEGTPWVEFKKEAAVQTAFDAQSAVAALLARMRKAQAAGMSIEHKAQALADAKALVLMLEAPGAPVAAVAE